MKLSRPMATAVGALALALAAGGAKPLQAQGQSDNLSLDGTLIREAVADHTVEIRLGTIAKKKASNPSVKQFGEQMVNDHTRMLEEWKALVTKNGYPFRPGLSKEQEQEVKRLDQTSGPEFDRAYMASMIQDHQNAIAKYQGQGQAAHSVQVRQVVSAELPTLQQHLSLASQVGRQVGVYTGVVATTPNTPVPTQNPPVVTGPVVTRHPPVATANTEEERQNLKRDRRFIQNVMADHTLEIQLNQLAQTRAVDPAVRQYAQTVGSDHAAMQNELIAMGAGNGLNLKPGMGKLHRKKVDQLKKLSGSEFDRAYMRMEVQNSQAYLGYYQKDGREAHSSQVQSLSNEFVPVLQRHRDQAQNVARRLGVNVAAALEAL